MSDKKLSYNSESYEFDFITGQLGATLALIHALISQNAVDKNALNLYLSEYSKALPHTRQTLPMRLVIDQWLRGLAAPQPLCDRVHAGGGGKPKSDWRKFDA